MFKLLLSATLFLFSLASSVNAFKAETFISHVFLIDEVGKQTISNIETVYDESTPSAVFQDWILTTSALKNATLSAYIKGVLVADKNQKIGFFLELPEGVFLDKLPIEERKREVDKQMEAFFAIFGEYPKVVSAKTIDSKSLSFLVEKYSVLSFVYLPGQHPQVPSTAGGYLFSPFFPSAKNHYQPSRDPGDRINLVVSEPLALDPEKPEDTLIFFSQKKLNEFTQLSSYKKIDPVKPLPKNETKNLYAKLKSVSDKYSLHQKSLSEFSDWYLARYPQSTPAFFYEKNANQGKEFVYQNPWYRFVFSQRGSSVYQDSLYVYQSDYYEPSYETANPAQAGIYHLNKVSFQDELLVTLKESNLFTNYLKQFDYWQMTLQNQSEKIILGPQSIAFHNLAPVSLSDKNIKIKDDNKIVTWHINDTHAKNSLTLNFWFFLALVIFFAIKLFKKPGSPPLLGLVLVLIACLTSFRSGQVFPFGLAFWGPHGHDAIFHLSLIQSFQNNLLDLGHPQMSGEVIGNYHLFFDYISALILKVSGLPLLSYYFILFPLTAGLAIVFLLNKLLNEFNLSLLQKKITYLLVFFASSFGFLVRLFAGQDYFSGESAFWSNQSLSMFLNPPFLLSLVFLLIFLILFSKKNKTNKDLLWLVVFGTLLAQTKIYAFILLVVALFWQGQIYLSIAIGILGLAITLPFSSVDTSPFLFQPLWFIRTMFESHDRFYIQQIANSWQAYESSGQLLKVFALSAFGLITFWIGNLGLRVLGLVQVISSKPENHTDSLIRKIILISLVLPLIVTQSVNPWNSIQFLYYGLFFLGIFTAKALPKKGLLLYFLLALGIFGSIGTIKDYLTKNSSARVSHQELQALYALELLPPGIVLSPSHTGQATKEAPHPLYDYVSTAYISALTGKKEFLSDTINLDITGLSYKQHSKSQNRFYSTTDRVWAKQFLLDNNIKYVIETPIRRMSINPAEVGLTLHFDAGEVKLYILINQ